MANQPVSNPNDYKVVEFRNSTDFTFTPEMGCMYDGRPIFGITGAPGVNAGESLTLPYHIGYRLAENLAKMVQLRRAPATDPAGIPTGVPLWSIENLDVLKSSFIKELYSEDKPAMVSETDKLMAKVEEYKRMVDTLISSKSGGVQLAEDFTNDPQLPVIPGVAGSVTVPQVYQDKQEVIAELEKRSIQHDKRKNKVDLEKLLAPVAA